MTSSSQEQQQKNKQVIRQFFEAFDRHDIESMEQLVSTANYSLHFSGMPPMDWNGHKQLIATITRAFPDIHHDIEDVVAEGADKVAIRMNVTGTHKGEFLGVQQSDKKGSITSMDFFTIIDGKFVEHWVNADMMGLMQQIGAIPTPPSPATDTSTARS
jgi:steroid delta-isomerase-like uncharacterized protein